MILHFVKSGGLLLRISNITDLQAEIRGSVPGRRRTSRRDWLWGLSGPCKFSARIRIFSFI